jgi:hypothetical protein
MFNMVVAIRFPDIDEFNLFCRLRRLSRNEIIDIFHDRGGIILVLDRPGSEPSEWDKKKQGFLKELKG